MAKPAPGPIPEGMHTLTTHLWFNGNCQEAVAFYQKALGAMLAAPVVMGPGGKSVLHAMLAIGDSPFMLADAWPGTWEKGPDGSSTVGLWVYVEDCDALFKRAVDAGCESEFEMMDAFWGGDEVHERVGNDGDRQDREAHPSFGDALYPGSQLAGLDEAIG